MRKSNLEDTVGGRSSPLKSIIDPSTVTVIDQSPRLKPRNMSKFDALRSIFEPNDTKNLSKMKIMLADSKKDLSRRKHRVS